MKSIPPPLLKGVRGDFSKGDVFHLMSENKSANPRNAALGLLILLLISFLSLNDAEAGESEWKLLGKIDNGNFLLYTGTKSISYTSENIFRIRAKKELSREAFDESVRRAEKESGAKVEDPEGLFKIIVKSEMKEYLYEIDCEKNELRNVPLQTSAINLVTVSPILPGSAEEKIKKEFCKGK